MSSRKISFAIRVAAIVVLCGGLASVAFANCDAANAKSFTAEEITARLRDRRDRCLREGNFVDVFPALYFESTSAIIDESRSMTTEDAQLLNEQISLFYDAFEVNRLAFESKGASSVEPHWKAYYRNAVRLEKKGKNITTIDAIDLVLSGVEAHLTDLPRSIRYQLRLHPGSAERLKMLYFRLDKLFPAIVRNFDKHLAAAFGKRGISAPQFSLFNIGASYVTHSRHNAWELAAGNEELRTKKPQPRLCK